MKSFVFKLNLFLILIGVSTLASAQNQSDTTKTEKVTVEKLKYKQQPGLALAASKIVLKKP